jgi:hypothetical protein
MNAPPDATFVLQCQKMGTYVLVSAHGNYITHMYNVYKIFKQKGFP